MRPIDDCADVPHVPATPHLRLVVTDTLPVPQRRRTPRRQLVMTVTPERRSSDRRQRRPGIDGLLRTVLSDVWH